MRYPLTISAHQSLIIARQDYFKGIGLPDEASGVLRINLSRRGEKGYSWLIDANGSYYPLTWQATTRPTLFSRLGLTRQQETYKLGPAQPLTCAQLGKMLNDHTERYAEAPNVADLRQKAEAGNPDAPLNRAFMQDYLGE